LRFRFTLLGALGVVLFVALALAAVTSGTVAWVSAVSLVVLTWLCVAVTGALLRRGEARAFWIGFAVFGWVYMLLIHLAVVSSTVSEQMGRSLRDAVEAAVPSPNIAPEATPEARIFIYKEAAQYRIRVRVICDYFLNLGFAFSGGLIAVRFAAQDAAERPKTRDTT
jgi:hypothetical protein